MSLIFHIAVSEDWARAEEEGVYSAASLDLEGFIHGSPLDQVVETANLYFRGRSGLKLLLLDSRLLLAPVKYEAPAGSGGRDPSLRFPHIYGVVNLSAVVGALDFLPSADGSFVLPDLSDFLSRLD